MLNRAERFQVLRMIRLWCKLGSLPVQVDLSTWQILPHAKRQTRWKCLFWFFLFALHGLYKLVALAYWLKVGIPLHQAVVHAMLAALASVYSYWYYFLYIQNPRLFGMYVNKTLTGYEDDYQAALDRQNVRSWSRRLKECALQDIFAMSVSYTVPASCVAIMLAFISNPSMKCLLYAALPKEHQMWITFGILLVEEWRSLMVLCSTAIPVWIVQVISFDLVINKLQLLVQSMQRAARSQRSGHVYKSLRHIQLYVGVTNLVNQDLIFSYKLVSIGISIGTWYAAIAHFGDYPIFGVMYYNIFLNAAFIYIFCYDQAFKIPALFQRVTQRAVLATRATNPQASKIFKRQIRSIPRVGIKVGEFHLMERKSTFIFIHFVLNNIVSMLVVNREG